MTELNILSFKYIIETECIVIIADNGGIFNYDTRTFQVYRKINIRLKIWEWLKMGYWVVHGVLIKKTYWLLQKISHLSKWMLNLMLKMK
jgi:hypothetical protein